ncbi:MAG: hypothetical protein EOO38_13720 [Cytophagaceae bacterium]|nr:MAG: hypothetical protein EOO38_13720 [Cytophagaceae bacterium]
MRLSSSGRLRTATPDAEALGLRVARPSNGVLLPAPTQQQQQQQLHVHTAATTPSVSAEKGSGLMYLPAPYPSALAFGQMAAGERATSATTAPTPSQLHVQRDVSAVSEARSVSFWERHEPAIEAGMMNAFEDLLQRMKELMNTCMHLLSPELISSKAELIQRLSPFSLTVMRSRREPKAIASAAASVRHLHDAILASKLEVFRSMLQVVLEQCELVFPEASAALEILSLGHFELFGLYMNGWIVLNSELLL